MTTFKIETKINVLLDDIEKLLIEAFIYGRDEVDWYSRLEKSLRKYEMSDYDGNV